MKALSFAVLALVFGLAAADLRYKVEEHVVNPDIISHINENARTWKAAPVESNKFAHMPMSDIQRMLGLKGMEKNAIRNYLLKHRNEVNFEEDVVLKEDSSNSKKLQQVIIPTSFDARQQWPNCIHSVRDQGSCGSCWAFSSTAMLEDRICIATNEAVNVRLSPQDMVSCDYSSSGCNGGWLSSATNYLMTSGVVSDDCLPYASEDGFGRRCSYKCSTFGQEYVKYGCKANSLKMPTKTQDIQLELMTNGPLHVGFIVYNDFMSYSSGIYQPTVTTIAGAHAVKLIGWGTDTSGSSPRLFWILQNQWGTEWGEAGYFRIYAGKCGLDAVALACDPDTI